MTELSLDTLLTGFVTRVEHSESEGVIVVVQNDTTSYRLVVKACACGKPCDLVTASVERIHG